MCWNQRGTLQCHGKPEIFNTASSNKKSRGREENQTLGLSHKCHFTTNITTPKMCLPPSGRECFVAELWLVQEGQMSRSKIPCREQWRMTWLFYTPLLPPLLTFILPQCLWQSIALIGTLLPPAQNSTSYSNMFSIMHQGLSWQA